MCLLPEGSYEYNSVCCRPVRPFFFGLSVYFFPQFLGLRFKKYIAGQSLVLEKSSYYTQNAINGSFLGLKPTFLKFYLNRFIKYFRNCN